MKLLRLVYLAGLLACAAGCGKVNLKCSPGTTACPSGCADVTTDGRNCGACGVTCGVDQACVGGSCTCTAAGMTSCGSTCVDLTSDTANCGACGNGCATGQLCVAGSCACTSGLTSCTSGCADLQNDNANCGSCDHACVNGTTCIGGQCVCPSSSTVCSGVCVDTATDNSNCGACGNACTGGKSCQGGACVCTGGKMDCSGTCVDEQTDNNHCGNCTTVCGAGKSCTTGSCQCTGGKTDCSGTCVDEQTDNNHCGGCTTVCSGGKSCMGGNCVCPTGQVDCGGTCFVVTADRSHCGSTCQVCTSTQICNNGCVAAPAPTFTSIWGDPTGWTDSNNMPIQASLGPASGVPGIVYQCRTGPAATIGSQAFGNCDGMTGTMPTHKPTAGANGSFQTDYRYTQGSYTSPVASFPFYVHSSLNGVAKCPPKFTDAQYFTAAQSYATANPTKFTIPATPLFTGDASLKLKNPFIVVPFKQVQKSNPMFMPGSPWTMTAPFDYTTKDLSLRHKFVLSSDNKLLLFKRNFKGTGGSCQNMSASHTHGNRSPNMQCDAFVLNIHGQGLCISGAGSSPAVVANFGTGGAYPTGWNLIRGAPYTAALGGTRTTNLCGAASCQSSPVLIFLPP